MEKLNENGKKTIAIDASRSNVRERTGTEYYSFEIIREIVKDSRFSYRLYSKSPLDYIKKSLNIETKVINLPRLWSQIGLSWEIFRNPPDAAFFPAHTIPIHHGKKTVVTLHDIGFKYFPELYTPLERIYHNFSMGFSLKHATKIIAISASTKNDLIKIYKADPSKITVIYHGYDKEKYYQPSLSQDIPEKIKKLGSYIYFIGRLEAKKNLVNLIKAFETLRQDNPKINHKLVLAGRPGYLYEDIRRQIEMTDIRYKNDIIELGYVADNEVGNLMRFASIFAFPSRFEGFGMPLVEAMACGVPIVATNKTSIPEIVDKCALLTEPDDYKKLAQNMRILIEDKTLRSRLIEDGLERSKKFDWEKCAKETLSVIELALEN